jgi:predicted ATP-grasp superfamily ATP-dependent carboligase
MPKGEPNRVLITSSRMPFAVDEIRKFGEAGHEVFASDTFAYAPGSHSKYVVAGLITPSPSEQPAAFVEALEQFVQDHAIDQLVPCFEEVFYITRRCERLCGMVDVFAPRFETLARLHDKVAFLELARELGMTVPTTHVVDNRDDLRAATNELGTFFARPSFSRGGVDLYTNTGELAGELQLDDCTPTPDNPWLVQEFIEGEDVCSFSVARHGRLTAHASYIHPKTFEGAGGITFESVDAPDVLDAARRVVEATGYHGQISLDFLRTARGLMPVECNPRPTAGVTLMPTDAFVTAVRGNGGGPPAVVPAGERRKISAALIRDMLLNWRAMPSNLAALVSGGDDIYAALDDLLPAIYQFVGYFHLLRRKKTEPAQSAEPAEHRRTTSIKSYFHDICWDGRPIP